MSNKSKELLNLIVNVYENDLINGLTDYILTENIDISFMSDEQLTEFINQVIDEDFKTVYKASKPYLKKAGKFVADLAKEQATELGRELARDAVERATRIVSDYAKDTLDDTEKKVTNKLKNRRVKLAKEN